MTKTITLHLPDLIFEKAQSIAALQKLNLHDFLLDAIVLPEINLESLAETDDMANAAEREEQAFQELHPMLIEKYPGQFVAVMDGRLIDRDANQVALYQRVRQTYPERFVLIAQIQEMPDEVIVFRSPRIAYEGINGSN